MPNATAEQVFNTLLSSEEHSALIGDTAEVSAEVGGTFETFSGYSDGKNIELFPGKKIVQTWRASDWPTGHYSTITFELSDSDDGVVIQFTQDNIPDGHEEEFVAGWEDNYWVPFREFYS